MADYPPVGAKILVACADVPKRRTIAAALAQDGYDAVYEASSGLQVVQHIAADRPQLVVAHIRLRGWNGLDLVRGLRGSDWEVPFILIAGNRDDEAVRRAGDLGAPCVFREPYTLEDLRTVALASLRSQRKGRSTWGVWNEALRHAPPRGTDGART